MIVNARNIGMSKNCPVGTSTLKEKIKYRATVSISVETATCQKIDLSEHRTALVNLRSIGLEIIFWNISSFFEKKDLVGLKVSSK